MPYLFKLPDVGEGLHEAEIIRWMISEGEQIAADQPMVEVQTDKAAVELTSPVAGTVVRLNGAAGDLIRVGSVIVEIETGSVTTIGVTPSRAHPGMGRWAPATPSTRRLARELGVDVNALRGTGPAGRVTDEDVRLAASPVSTPVATPDSADILVPAGGPATKTTLPLPPAGAPRPDQRLPLRGVRAVIARRMTAAKQTIPHAAAIEEVDMGAIMAMREELKAAHPDLKLSYLPFLVKAAARALHRCPALNARLDDAAGEIVLRGEVNIGIATATEEGLLVPVVRDADRKSILTIAAEISDLAARGRTRKLKPEELSGSTFTITNIGALGGLLSVPIINHPEVAILGFHRIQERPVGRDGQIVLRPMSYLTLAFDHRVADGDLATSFLTLLTRYLEQPSRLLAEMI